VYDDSSRNTFLQQAKKKPELMMPRSTALDAALHGMVPRSKLAGTDSDVQRPQKHSAPAHMIHLPMKNV
jgi:hypothetical protein